MRGLLLRIASYPRGRPTDFLHSNSFSKTWKSATVFFRVLCGRQCYERESLGRTSYFLRGTLPYVTEIRRMSSSSGVALRDRRRPTISSTPGKTFNMRFILAIDSELKLTWIGVDNNLVRSHGEQNRTAFSSRFEEHKDTNDKPKQMHQIPRPCW